MMTCEQLTRVVSDYIDGHMALMPRTHFKLHLLMCRNCRTYLNQFRKSTTEARTLPPDDMPQELTDAMLKQFRDWR